MRTWVLAGTALLALVAGCGSPDPEDGSRLTVYLSAPAGSDGRALAAGAERALAAADGQAGGVPVELVELEGSADPVAVAENARETTEDSTSIAYIGEASSQATRTSLPITNDAGMLQLSPSAGAGYLLAPFKGSDDVPPETQSTGVRTFGTLAPLEGSPQSLGYEVMALVLDSIERADDPLARSSVVGAFFDTEERDSKLGTYSIDELGQAEGHHEPSGAQ